MDKHKLGEILKILPDDFSFKAVYEDDSTSSYAKGQDKGELSKQELQEREIWEDMQESCEYCQTHYYDLDSKQWIDVKSHWLRRIKERLESNKIFIDDTELESLLNGTHTMFQPSYDWWIKPEDCYYKHFHHYKDFFYYELKIFMDYYKMACFLYLQNDKWLDYESYWHIRVRQELESNGIFMGDKEFESLLNLTHPIIKESFSWCEKISDLGRYELHNFIVEYKERF